MNNSRTKNSLLNMGASIGYQMLNLVLSFVSRTVFLQVLGVGYLGINGLFSDVLSMLNMAELGFGTAMTYSMYKPLAENDQDTLAGLTHFYKKVYRIIALTIAVIGVVLVPFLPYLINLEQEIPHVELYYLLFLASNVASYLVVSKTTVLYADQKNYIMLQHGAYWHTAEVITMLLVLWLSKNYTLYLVTQVIFVYSRNFYMSHLASKHYPYLSKKVTLPKERTKGIFKDVGSAFLYKIADVLITATDNTLISVLVSTEMVGYYSNYHIIVGKLSNIVGTMFTSLIASLGNLIVKESAEHRYQVFQVMQTVSLILSTFCVTCLLLLEEDFIRIELIIVNDGSTDRSEDIILDWKDRFEEKGYCLKYFSQENSGQAAATSHALKHVTGTYLTLLDADDYFLQGSIRKRVLFLDEHPECVGVRSNGWMVRGELKELFITSEEEKSITNMFDGLLFGKTNNWAGSYMIRTDALFEFYPDRSIYPSRFGQNMQILLPVAYKRNFGYIDEPLMAYVIHEDSHSQARAPEEQYQKDETNQQGYRDIYLYMLDMILKEPEEHQKYRNIFDASYYRCAMFRAQKYRKQVQLEESYHALAATGYVTLNDKICYYNAIRSPYVFLLKLLRKAKSLNRQVNI